MSDWPRRVVTLEVAQISFVATRRGILRYAYRALKRTAKFNCRYAAERGQPVNDLLNLAISMRQRQRRQGIEETFLMRLLFPPLPLSTQAGFAPAKAFARQRMM
jgi:hypothetical protein